MIQDFGDAARYESRNGYDKWWTKLITKKKKKKENLSIIQVQKI